jgi:hypothetical protein
MLPILIGCVLDAFVPKFKTPDAIWLDPMLILDVELTLKVPLDIVVVFDILPIVTNPVPVPDAILTVVV